MEIPIAPVEELINAEPEKSVIFSGLVSNGCQDKYQTPLG
jgi:hypothetical protein